MLRFMPKCALGKRQTNECLSHKVLRGGISYNYLKYTLNSRKNKMIKPEPILRSIQAKLNVLIWKRMSRQNTDFHNLV